jgi:hypothetical protein
MAPVSFPLASGGLERYVQELRWVEFIADRDFVIVELTEEEEKRLAGCPFTPADQTDET